MTSRARPRGARLTGAERRPDPGFGQPRHGPLRLIEDILIDEDARLNWLNEETRLLETLGDVLYLARNA